MVDNQIRLVRPADLLVATLQLDNLVLASDGSALVRVTPDAPAAVILRLPPQHYLEPSVTPVTTHFTDSFPWLTEAPAYVVPLLASSGARFEWTLPDGVARLELGTGPAGLFEALAELDASPGGTQFDVLVDLWFSSLELDWALPPAPDGETPRHPLWRIRPDVPHGTTFPAGLPMHPTPQQKLQLDVVFATTTGVDYERNLLAELGIDDPMGGTVSYPFPYFKRSFLARELTATPLGGTVSFFGPIPPPGESPDPDAFGYEHRTSLGRDVFIRRAVWGWLSSGHRAVVTTFAERVIRAAQILDHGGAQPADTTTATLLSRAELVVTEPVLDLAAHAGEYQYGGREIPFTALRLDVERLDIDVPQDQDAARVITSGGTPISFDLTATDHTGRTVTLRTQLAFLPDGRPASDLATLIPEDGVQASLAPTAVAIALEAGRPAGSTSITVTGIGLTTAAGASRPVLPAVGALRVGVDALAGLADEVPVVAAAWDPTFLAHGLERAANPLGTLLTIEPVTLSLPTASVGGLGNPGGVVDLITAERGAVPAALASGPPSEEQIAAAFPLPKLLGRIDLRKLLDTSSFPAVDGLPSVPRVARSGPPGAETLTYHFEARLTRSAPELGLFVNPDDATLVLDARLTRSGAGGVVATSTGSVTGIWFELAGSVRLRLKALRFATDAGGKTSVDLDEVEVEFLGALEFLAEIARRLATLGGGSGTRVDVDASGVTAGFQLAIPTIAMGVMQLSNLAVAAFLRVPFTDAPLSFTLDVASRERPFRATVSLFGGGGFLSLEVTPSGLRRLEASIEFGGSMSLDIVVASGGVTVMAGIYFSLKIEETTQRLMVAGFVRASGHVTVLGIVSVFVEFRMQLEYKEVTVGGSRHAMFAGTASVTVGVKVLFFSKSVTLTVTREFLGSAADPSFLECVDEDDWGEYCLAYAGTGAPAVAGDPFGGAIA